MNGDGGVYLVGTWLIGDFDAESKKPGRPLYNGYTVYPYPKLFHARDAAFADYPFASEKNIAALYYGKPAPSRVLTQYDELVIENAFDQEAVKQIAMGNLDVNTALRQAEENANKLIQEQLAQK